MSQSQELSGKIVFVTGGSRGIGRAVSLNAARAGAKVVLQYVQSAQEATDLVGEIHAAGGTATAVQGDWADPESVRACTRDAWYAYGRIDVLVNNAGINHKRHFVDATIDEMDHLYHVNVRGPLICTQEVVRRMVHSGVAGRILTITSINALRPGEGFSLYGGAKAWLEISMKNIALELASDGIQVNTFPVGAVRTDMTRGISDDPEKLKHVNRGIAMGRMAEPDEIAAGVLAFAGDAGAYVTGSSLVLDGGLSLVRGIPDLSRQR